MTRLFSISIFLSALAACVALERSAAAMSCCGSTLAQPDRLGPCEHLALQVGASSAVSLGSFLSDGAYAGNPAQVFEGEERLRLSAAVRLSPAWQLSAGAAWVQGVRSYGQVRSTAGWFSDVLVGARFDPPTWTSWAFTAMVGLPSGRTMAESHDLLGADVTGQGAASLRAGAVYQRDWSLNYIVVGAGLTAVAPERGTGVQATVNGDLFGALGHTFRNRVNLAVSLSTAAAPPLTRQGEALPGSSWLHSTASLSSAWPLSYRSTLLASLFATPPTGLLARNWPLQVGVMVNLRWAWMGD